VYNTDPGKKTLYTSLISLAQQATHSEHGSRRLVNALTDTTSTWLDE
jgi:hypothetical protein